MQHQFRELDTRVDFKLADLERRITMRLGGMLVGRIGVVSILIKLF